MRTLYRGQECALSSTAQYATVRESAHFTRTCLQFRVRYSRPAYTALGTAVTSLSDRRVCIRSSASSFWISRVPHDARERLHPSQ